MDNSDHVAIIGGGLCGLALAIALKTRSIPFTLYESRASFTEIGAGINLGPSALQSLRMIDPTLGEKVYALATRNPAPDEETWMYLRYGASDGKHADGELIDELTAPPTGNLTLHRQELLKLLADRVGNESVKFGKKFAGYKQHEGGLSVEFEDGSVERASIVIGCDGIHSRVRAAMFGKENVVSQPSFGYEGCYRGMIPMEKAVAAIGETARRSQILLGPRGAVIMYPISGGKFLNCGAWPGKMSREWDSNTWVLPNQHAQFMQDFNDWGPTFKKLMELFPEDVSYWASYQHLNQPENFRDGRVLLIGDGAHAMPPHLGSGAAQAVEDACVLAEVFEELYRGPTERVQVEAALSAVEEVRKPRFLKVHQLSNEAGPRWFNFFNLKLEGDDLKEWKQLTRDRLNWIWGIDMAGQAEEAKQIMHEKLIAA